jgi:hypothetical protein
MCLPGEIFELSLSTDVVNKYFNWIEPSVVVTMIVIWAVNFWLLLKTPRTEL